MPTRTVTLAANTVSTVTVAGEWAAVGVYVPDAAAAMVHVSLTATAPTPWANDTYAVPGGARRELPFGKTTGSTIKLISTGTPLVEVEFA